MTTRPRTSDIELKRAPGAYILLARPDRHTPILYCVESWDPTGSNSGRLWCTNARTEQRLWLTAREVDHATLVREAPTLEIPDALPEGATDV